jgi:hypothetical protein
MSLAELLPELRFVHILSAFVFVAGHGVSMFVAFRVRAEREPARMLALLDLSAWSLIVAFVGLLLLLVSGVAAGLAADSFGRGWIWVSLILLIVVAGLMTPIASAHFSRLRLALGQRVRGLKEGDPDPTPLPVEDVLAIARGRRPELALAIGVGGFVVIMWLMSYRPF